MACEVEANSEKVHKLFEPAQALFSEQRPDWRLLVAYEWDHWVVVAWMETGIPTHPPHVEVAFGASLLEALHMLYQRTEWSS